MTNEKRDDASLPSESSRNRERLHRLASYVAVRLDTLRIPLTRSADVDVANAAKALLRSVVVQAAAIDVLNRTQVAEAGGVNVRAILDATADLYYMLRVGDKLRNARKYHLNAVLEYRRYSEETGSDASELAAIDEEIDQLRSVDPDAFSEIEKQRAGKGPGRHHWSGRSRSAVIRQVEAMGAGAGPLSHAFALYSWDTHSVMTTFRDVRAVEIDGQHVLRHAHWQTQEETAELNASVAINALTLAWRTVAEEFSIPSWPTRGDNAAGRMRQRVSDETGDWPEDVDPASYFTP